jgi:hypothetical protein
MILPTECVPGSWWVETAAMDPMMLAAFPKARGPDARQASEGLAPARYPTGDRLIQDSYERRWGRLIVDGDEVEIPYRHYQDPAARVADPAAQLVRQAWLTRSSHGQVRQQAVRSPLRLRLPGTCRTCFSRVVST